MKEEYGSGFDGTPEQALKYAQDTPGQELEVRRLLKVIRNKKMSKTLKIIKEVVKEKLLREQAISEWNTKVTKKRKPTNKNANKNANKNVGGWVVTSQEAKKLNNLLPPPLPTKNPIRIKQRQHKEIKKQKKTPSHKGPLVPDKAKEKHWI